MSLPLKPGWSSGSLQRVMIPTHFSHRAHQAKHWEGRTLPDPMRGWGGKGGARPPCLIGGKGLEASEQSLPRGREHRIVKDAGTEFEKLGTGRKRIREVFILRVDICVGVCQQFRSCWCGGSPLRGAMRAPQRDSSLIIRFLCPEEREQRPFLSRGGGPSLRD